MATPINQFAFPSNNPTGEFSYSGMTLRDYFAAHALILINASGASFTSCAEIATAAGLIADAMLVERAG